LLRAPGAEEGSREVLTVEQFRATVESNPVEIFNMLNEELAMNKMTITQLNIQTEDLQAQLNAETAVLELANEQMTDLLSEQADLNSHIIKLSMQISQGGKLSSEHTAKMPDLSVLTNKKDSKFED
jgi:hypothetical protein